MRESTRVTNGSTAMRVAFDHQAFCRRPYTGISRYFTRLAEALATASVDVRIFAPLHVNAFLDSAPAALVQGRRVSRPPRPVRPALRGLSQVVARRAIRRFGPDLVHETYYQPRSAAPVGVPVVVTVYDLIHERYPADFPAYDRLLSAKRRAIRRAGRVLCISQRTREDLLAHYPDAAERAHVVHLGVSLPLPADPAAEARVRSAGGARYLLFVGQRGGYKNFSALLAAYAGSRQLRASVRLLCVGGDALSEAEQVRLRELGVADRLTRIDGSDALLGAAYRGALALVYPSRYEGFGLPLLEAMVHGCPVAASRGGALPEVLGDAGLSFDPDAVDEQRRALETLVACAATRERLRALGLARAKSFTWRRCADQTLAVYRSLLTDCRGAGQA